MLIKRSRGPLCPLFSCFKAHVDGDFSKNCDRGRKYRKHGRIKF